MRCLKGITKRKLAPTILPFTDKGTKSKIESKAIVTLKKIDIDTKADIEKRPPVNPKKLEEKGPERKVEKLEKPEGNPRKGPIRSPEVAGKRLEATKKPHKKPLKEAVVAPSATSGQPRQPQYQGPQLGPYLSPVRTPSPFSTPPSSTPLSPLVTSIGRTSSNGDSRRN